MWSTTSAIRVPLFRSDHCPDSSEPAANRKRAQEKDTLPLARLQKRRIRFSTLYADDLESLCTAMGDLSHALVSSRVHDFDVLSTTLHDLDIGKTDFNRDRSFDEFLAHPWYMHLSRVKFLQAEIQRAKRVCDACGLRTFRDILWYNDSLSQPATMHKLPNCLIDTAYLLLDWKPRRAQPDATLGQWRNAWQALAVAWPLVINHMPTSMYKTLMQQKHAQPPQHANWFEFNYFDNIYDHKEVLLCYRDDNEIMCEVEFLDTLVQPRDIEHDQDRIADLETTRHLL